MEYFCKIRNLEKNDPILRFIAVKNRNVTKYITSTSENDKDYILYTYYIKYQRQSDDIIYLKNPRLYELLPRSYSILVKNDTIIGILEGIQKFSGDSLSEDDQIDGTEQLPNPSNDNSITPFDTVKQWEYKKKLRIFTTEKANGKFCLFTVITDPLTGKKLVMGGSKNSHLVFDLDRIKYLVDLQSIYSDYGTLLYSIFKNIRVVLQNLNSYQLDRLFTQGHSITGELCDGKHFTYGNNNVKWFGMFKNGKTEAPHDKLIYLKSIGLETVDYSFKHKTLDAAILDSRIAQGEGSVLYCINLATRECILIKSKSVVYIVKRFIRQILLKGYSNLSRLQQRFADTGDYHGLSTEGAVRVTKFLHYFAFWMMSKKLPSFCLSNMDNSKIYTSFYYYWNMFVRDTHLDLEIYKTDFGKLDKQEYLEKTTLYKNRDKTTAPTVIFIQGLQGSGKSTIAQDLVEKLNAMSNTNENAFNAKYLEQDEYYGDTLACQGHLYHLIAGNVYKYLNISRCNINGKQYSNYLDVCLKLNARVLFASHELDDPLYLAVSMAGIYSRTPCHTGYNKLLLGKSLLATKEVYNIVMQNYRQAKSHEKAIKLSTIKCNDNSTSESLRQLASEKMNNYQEFTEFIVENKDALMNLRYSIDYITNQLIEIAQLYTTNTNEQICFNEIQLDLHKYYVSSRNFLYNGFFLNNQDKQTLIDYIIDLTGILQSNDKFVFYCDHVTQFFCKKKAEIPRDQLVEPFTRVQVYVNKVIIQKSTNSVVFKVASISSNGEQIKVCSNLPHISGMLPRGIAPSASLNVLGESNNNELPVDFRFSCMTLNVL